MWSRNRLEEAPAAAAGLRPLVLGRDLPQRLSLCPVVSGERVCDGLSLYHDAQSPLFYWVQTYNRALQITCFQFSGSYISLAFALDAIAPDVERAGRATVSIGCNASRPLTVFVRLNIVSDGLQQTLHETVVVDRGLRSTNFDLSGLPNAAGEISNLWVDVIFTEPSMTELVITELQVTPE